MKKTEKKQFKELTEEELKQVNGGALKDCEGLSVEELMKCMSSFKKGYELHGKMHMYTAPNVLEKTLSDAEKEGR